jgi:hypothetical protein
VSFAPLPATACWEHRAARSGFEVAYSYAAPAFGFTCTLVYDSSGLVLDYPGIAVRVG